MEESPNDEPIQETQEEKSLYDFVFLTKYGLKF